MSYKRSDAESLFDLFGHFGHGYQVLEADSLTAFLGLGKEVIAADQKVCHAGVDVSQGGVLNSNACDAQVL